MAGCCDTCGIFCKLTMIALTVVGIILSLVSAASCEFLISGWINGYGLGLFKGYIGEPIYGQPQCVGYNDNDPDFSPNNVQYAAMVCSVLAPIFGLTGLVLGLVQFLFCKFCCFRCCISVPYTAAQICQGMTFLMFDIRTCQLTCRLGKGGICSIAAWACYFCAAVILCFTPAPEPMCRRKHDEEDGKEPSSQAPAPAPAPAPIQSADTPEQASGAPAGDEFQQEAGLEKVVVE